MNAATTSTTDDWIYRDGLVLAAGDWMDEKGKKHRDFQYPLVIAQVPESWHQEQHGNLLAAAPAMALALKAMLKRERQRFADTEEGDRVFRQQNAAALAAIAKAEA